MAAEFIDILKMDELDIGHSKKVLGLLLSEWVNFACF